jgi:hypothetical protein
MRLEVITAVVMTCYIFCDITLCSPVKINRRFGGTCRLHLQTRSKVSGFLLGLLFDHKYEATSYSETSVNFQQTARRYIRKHIELFITTAVRISNPTSILVNLYHVFINFWTIRNRRRDKPAQQDTDHVELIRHVYRLQYFHPDSVALLKHSRDISSVLQHTKRDCMLEQQVPNSKKRCSSVLTAPCNFLLHLDEATILLRAFPVTSSKHYQPLIPRSLKMRNS